MDGYKCLKSPALRCFLDAQGTTDFIERKNKNRSRNSKRKGRNNKYEKLTFYQEKKWIFTLP